MFKKLKSKIAEEVKSSPSRIQQFAQATQVNNCVTFFIYFFLLYVDTFTSICVCTYFAFFTNFTYSTVFW